MQWYQARNSNSWGRSSMYTLQHSLQAQMQHSKNAQEKHQGGKDVLAEKRRWVHWCKSSPAALVSHMHTPATLPNHPYLHGASGREMPVLPASRGCCLHLVMFIKMAVVSYLNVNYCYDTQDNLTCFSNLFFPLIRCSNWKIFQSVTTVLKVKWWRGRDLCHRNSTMT